MVFDDFFVKRTITSKNIAFNKLVQSIDVISENSKPLALGWRVYM